MGISKNWLRSQMFSQQAEKTNIDAILSRRDIEKINELFKKDIWEKQDLQELMHLLSGAEVKMLKFSDEDRYLLGKFKAWIDDFVTIGIQAFDIKEKMEEQEELTDEERDIMNKAMELTHHTIRYLVSIFLFLARSSLSLGGEAFSRFTEERVMHLYPPETPPQKTGLVGRILGRG